MSRGKAAVARKGSNTLTQQQRRFVAEYMCDFDGQNAAERAGYSVKNTGIGTHLMQNPVILDELRRRCLAAQHRLEMTADDVRSGLARIATDPREPKDGGPSWDARINAWVQIAKLLGMYTHKIQVTGSLTLVDLLLAADAKVVAEQPATVN